MQNMDKLESLNIQLSFVAYNIADTDIVSSVSFSPDGKNAVSSSHDESCVYGNRHPER